MYTAISLFQQLLCNWHLPIFVQEIVLVVHYWLNSMAQPIFAFSFSWTRFGYWSVDFR